MDNKLILSAIVGVILVFGAMFVAPLVAIYFWNGILTTLLNVSAPSYWAMFSLLTGLRWMLLADIQVYVSKSYKIMLKEHVADTEKATTILQDAATPWASMGIVFLLTYLCK